MKKSNPKLVIFEGADKVGKTTLFKLFRKETDYIPLAIDRFTGSNFVYDIYYNRKTILKEYILREDQLDKIFDCYLILVVCEPKTLLERIEKEEFGVDRDIARQNFIYIQSLFIRYFDNATKYSKKLIVDTTGSTPENSLKEILQFIEEA